MRQEDVPQVAEIDREAFYTQWPPPNYRQELQNQLARYVVAYKEIEERIPEEARRSIRQAPVIHYYSQALVQTTVL